MTCGEELREIPRPGRIGRPVFIGQTSIVTAGSNGRGRRIVAAFDEVSGSFSDCLEIDQRLEITIEEAASLLEVLMAVYKTAGHVEEAAVESA